ncbi:MAG: 2,3-bisphosphoglycerate-independent phosphoglycerate mutase [Alphaproteobacteria bacterium]|nr:2,3-bisphosphoglycerate-independent phosphoglycerate mutase [Alphaproteobacteria bacterium]MBQ9236172.1 2,3-bisphosphoglycerate-independent phosphoglycerate mutase [Alphaproteobacteria bacterium]
MAQKPVMLLILDGWGYREKITPDNAIEQGCTPNWHRLLNTCPHSFVETSGLAVGLPEGQMGNSEVGHTNLGAGRVVMQDLPKIDLSIQDGSLAQNPVLQNMISRLVSTGKTCHLMGLMSPGGVHSMQRHILALAEILSKAQVKVKIHAFLDGRDTPPSSAADYLAEFTKDIAPLAGVDIATLSGRFYAMDRDKRWDRVEKAYNAIALAQGERFANTAEAIRTSYAANVTDEFVIPCVIGDYQGISDGDAVLMANFRADRAREILYALGDRDFTGFARSKTFALSACVGMTEYSADHRRFMQTIFPPEALVNILGEVVAHHGLSQLRIAETEKYAHVTFFFNGGEEKEFAGEKRILIPSPKVATYDLKPEMSVYEVTEQLLSAITSQSFDVIICNFANGDMVGHTGIMDAALKAVAAVDDCLGKVEAAIKQTGGVLLVTADHGNVEKMMDETTHQPYTAHTIGKVQLVLVNDQSGVKSLKDGRLADIAPTMLELLNLDRPSEMTGRSLLEK